MVYGVARFTADLYFPANQHSRIPTWLTDRLVRHCKELANRDFLREPLPKTYPSAISNSRPWWSIMETLPHLIPEIHMRHEYRYPYLDRDLVDFLLRIPREQLVQPGRRRFLMRRALKDIVPSEILERRRKAYISRGPLAALQNGRRYVEQLLAQPLVAECGFVDALRLRAAAESILSGRRATQWPQLMKTIHLELWLRSL